MGKREEDGREGRKAEKIHWNGPTKLSERGTRRGIGPPISIPDPIFPPLPFPPFVMSPHPSSSSILLIPLFIFLFLFSPKVANGLVCRKDKVGPLGINDYYGGMNVDCGQYVQHCIKVLMWDGSVIRDCDPLALCPRDGSKVIKYGDYFCCTGNVCNGGERRPSRGPAGAILVPLFVSILFWILAKSFRLSHCSIMDQTLMV